MGLEPLVLALVLGSLGLGLGPFVGLGAVLVLVMGLGSFMVMGAVLVLVMGLGSFMVMGPVVGLGSVMGLGWSRLGPLVGLGRSCRLAPWRLYSQWSSPDRCAQRLHRIEPCHFGFIGQLSSRYIQ